MKRLILMRHAKSDWSAPGGSDHDRPLNPRGEKAARKIGKWLSENDRAPDQILCSTATRCRQTWDGVEASLASGVAPDFTRDLYLAEPQIMADILSRAVGQTVMMIAHNPGTADLAEALVTTPPDDLDFYRYPTGATTLIDFDIDTWSDLTKGACTDFIIPRSL